ncbi:MAG: hypothetical protein A2636_06265, partial [Elusimicrobia bacterium RIFCSPHIGHO2_01_FULL_64_10]
MSPIKRIALVGLGKIGLYHLSILRNIDEVHLVGLMDEKDSARKTVQGMGINAPFFDDLDKMLSASDPEGVFACVPPGAAPAIAEKCLRQGRALFLEKPMAADLGSAKKMMALLADRPSPPANAVGFMVAYYPTFEKTLDLLRKESIGRPRHYVATMLLGEVFRRQEGWRQNPALSGGGAVAVLGSHLLYLIQSFFGLPETVSAGTVRLFSNVEDICHARFSHPGGLTGEFRVSWSQPGYSEMSIRLEISGSEGFLDSSESSVSLYGYGAQAGAADQPAGPAGWQTWYPWDLSG